MRLKPPRTQVGFRRAPAAARGAKCAKRSSLVDPGSVVGERRLFDAESEDVSDGLGSGAHGRVDGERMLGCDFVAVAGTRPANDRFLRSPVFATIRRMTGPKVDRSVARRSASVCNGSSALFSVPRS